MKVVDNSNDIMTFYEIGMGGVFRYKNEIYIKCAICVIGNNRMANALNLRTGEFEWVLKDTLIVSLPDAKLITK